MTMKAYNVGIIGYGMSAKVFHIPLIEVVPELKLHAIVQRNPTGDNDASKDHPGVKNYRAAEDLVRDSSVDIVVVTTTPPTHFELAKLALDNGNHVIVEKPFVPTFKEADELIELARKTGKLLAIYQNRRWDSDFLTVRNLLKDDTLGRITEFESHFDRHKPTLAGAKAWKSRPEPGGGAIYDLGTHLIDQIYTLFGLPKKITAFIGSQRENKGDGYEDSCTVLLHYEGMMATAKVAIVSPEAAQLRFWVRGEKGGYRKAGEDCQEGHLAKGMKPGDDGFGIEPQEWRGTLTTVEDGKLISRPHPTVESPTYKAFYAQFAQAVKGEAEVHVKPEDARAVIRLIELAKQSSNEGRTIGV